MCHEHCLNGGVCSLNEEDEPFCECTAGYDGQRCEVALCKDHCGGTEGGTKLSCDANNSGEREVNACHQYCLNDGVCSLNENSEPVCQCPADYAGARCDVPAFLIKCFLYIYKNLSPVTLSKAAQATCASPDALGIPDL
ncbi:hypothetical protein PYW07_010727 [Mythimna separata]|uniref:EGF-like domain-containing protein n=1 Tax=Mythimna separata TaxID=271217 RepID=A0AAD7Y861_MYTSE|nr:hypothetical protein PYW07_010727 [Mythimna separata]